MVPRSAAWGGCVLLNYIYNEISVIVVYLIFVIFYGFVKKNQLLNDVG